MRRRDRMRSRSGSGKRRERSDDEVAIYLTEDDDLLEERFSRRSLKKATAFDNPLFDQSTEEKEEEEEEEEEERKPEREEEEEQVTERKDAYSRSTFDSPISSLSSFSESEFCREALEYTNVDERRYLDEAVQIVIDNDETDEMESPPLQQQTRQTQRQQQPRQKIPQPQHQYTHNRQHRQTHPPNQERQHQLQPGKQLQHHQQQSHSEKHERPPANRDVEILKEIEEIRRISQPEYHPEYSLKDSRLHIPENDIPMTSL